MIALAVLFVAAVELPALVWFCGLLYALDHAGQTETRATGCGKAMTAIGWKLPPRADREDCYELDDPAFASEWSGTFRMPRSEVPAWIASRPAPRHPKDRTDDYGTATEDAAGLHLNLDYPRSPNFGNGGIDKVTVGVAWEGEDSAVVTFKTYDD
ncbi:hypothetical protein [Streptomyces virginiae]|uniref:hypothetical protein n=1 Tax=Streptomyces virginiae TaxID=1961 RepID=UPI002251B678|nr:hypothetical protein [Streptomyces virginiae]MCX4959717.1 hypothetical protein [Streptomyces virginiae]MCX5178540.1 hypothetical protein [Streptomyces virginiae]